MAAHLDAAAALDAREVVDPGAVAEADRLGLEQERLGEDLHAFPDEREPGHELLRLVHRRAYCSTARTRASQTRSTCSSVIS